MTDLKRYYILFLCWLLDKIIKNNIQLCEKCSNSSNGKEHHWYPCYKCKYILIRSYYSD